MCVFVLLRAKLRTVAASNNRDHASQSLLLLLARATYTMSLFFAHIPFVVNHTINATPLERCTMTSSNETSWKLPPPKWRAGCAPVGLRHWSILEFAPLINTRINTRIWSILFLFTHMLCIIWISGDPNRVPKTP